MKYLSFVAALLFSTNALAATRELSQEELPIFKLAVEMAIGRTATEGSKAWSCKSVDAGDSDKYVYNLYQMSFLNYLRRAKFGWVTEGEQPILMFQHQNSSTSTTDLYLHTDSSFKEIIQIEEVKRTQKTVNKGTLLKPEIGETMVVSGHYRCLPKQSNN